MSVERIRLRFSGLVIFFAQMASIFTGLIFVIIVTRSLTQAEFGSWTNIGQLVSTLTIVAGIFPFWAARFEARKLPGSMIPGLVANIGLLFPALIAFLAVAPLLALLSQTSLLNYVFGGVLITESYVIAALVPIVVVRKPHFPGYALLVFDILKILLITPLVVVLRLGLFGALTTLAIANFAQIVLYALAVRDLWFETPRFSYLSDWMRASPFNIYSAGSAVLATLNVLYLLPAAGGPLPVAFYGAAMTIATPIVYTVSLTTALYPKLLAGGTSRDVEAVWRLSLMFSVPLTLAVIFLAPSLLHVLEDSYVPAWRAVILLALSTLIITWGGIFDRIIIGTEKLELEGTISLRAVLNSRMSQAVTVSYLAHGVSLLLLWWLLGSMGIDAVKAAELTVLTVLLAQGSLTAAKYILARRSMSFHFPARSALKYCVVGGALLLVVPFLEQPLRASVTIVLFAAGAGLYLFLLYFLDEEARTLIRATLDELRSRMPFVEA